MKNNHSSMLALTLSVALLAAACADRGEPVGLPAVDDLAATLNPRQMPGPVWVAILTPLNARVGQQAVTGKATFSMDAGGTLTATVDVKGVVAGQLHVQHIHGHSGDATCPTPQADVDGDGVISVGEGVPNYGPVIVPLTPFATPAGSRYSYQQTFPNQGALEPERRAVVVHGAFVNGVYVTSLPVACGTIERVR